ncbi:hypothetical protein PAALTS15_15896 [Paenibacillus alvei TS-15]|uniref:Uncharacterized protein n=1 Tax=Paenibacillus alvei TS-15 TaxID=1117108 RepID=S9SKA4_PAEAL|nr:hypothetical protein PAALTS15_15896 [Paenibacillus alvei TS-15]
MRIWFLSGLLLVFISLLIALMTGMTEILVYFNFIVGLISLAIVFYIYIGLRMLYMKNEFSNNHDGADYQGRKRLQYKIIMFGLPNVVFGGIVNEIYNIWPWTS